MMSKSRGLVRLEHQTGPGIRVDNRCVSTKVQAASKRFLPRAAAVLVAGTLFAATGVVGSAAAAPLSGLESEVLALTNAARAAGQQCGTTLMPAAPALTWSDELAGIALAHSTDMAARNFFSHLDPDGVGPFDRMTRAGYTYSAAGENIGVGYPNAADVVAGWLASPGHCRNVMSPSFTELGVGYHPGTESLPHLWTQQFGARSIVWADESSVRGASQTPAVQASAQSLPSQTPAAPAAAAPAGAVAASVVWSNARRARVTWTAGSAAQYYRVRVVGPSGKAKWHRTKKLARTFTGLRPGTSYRFQLVSVGAAGKSPVVDLPFTTA